MKFIRIYEFVVILLSHSLSISLSPSLGRILFSYRFPISLLCLEHCNRFLLDFTLRKLLAKRKSPSFFYQFPHSKSLTTIIVYSTIVNSKPDSDLRQIREKFQENISSNWLFSVMRYAIDVRKSFFFRKKNLQ